MYNLDQAVTKTGNIVLLNTAKGNRASSKHHRPNT